MNCETQTLTISPVKKGDTFTLACTYKQDGTAFSVADLTIRSQIRDSDGNLVIELPVSKANQTTHPGVFVLGNATPPNFPIDVLTCDIQFSDVDGVVKSTQTFKIPVVEDVTS
jgi:hypothetical protein